MLRSPLPCIESRDLAIVVEFLLLLLLLLLPLTLVMTVFDMGELYLRLRGTVRSSGSSPPQLSASEAPARGGSSLMSLLRDAVGLARARSSAGLTLTPALANRRDANSGSNLLGIGITGRSFVLMPRCCRDMCECREFRDFATVPHRTQRYPGQTVCLSSKWVRNVCAERYILPHFGHGLGSVARTRIMSRLRRGPENKWQTCETFVRFIAEEKKNVGSLINWSTMISRRG